MGIDRILFLARAGPREKRARDGSKRAFKKSNAKVTHGKNREGKERQAMTRLKKLDH